MKQSKAMESRKTLYNYFNNRSKVNILGAPKLKNLSRNPRGIISDREEYNHPRFKSTDNELNHNDRKVKQKVGFKKDYILCKDKVYISQRNIKKDEKITKNQNSKNEGIDNNLRQENFKTKTKKKDNDSKNKKHKLSNSTSSDNLTLSWSHILGDKKQKDKNFKLKLGNNANNNIKLNSALQKGIKKSKTFKLMTKISKEKLTDYIIKANNDYIVSIYLKDILERYKELEQRHRIRDGFLDKHYISSEIRSKMIDWMIEVLGIYSDTKDTFFLSVKIFDKYLELTENKLCNKDVHLLGICCMYLALKFEEVLYIPLSSIATLVGHNTFSLDKIKEMETKILKTLSFNFVFTNINQFINVYFQDFFSNNSHLLDENRKKMFMTFKNLCEIVGQFVCIYYDDLPFLDSMLADAVFVISSDLLKANFEEYEDTDFNYIIEFVKFIIRSSGYSHADIFQISNLIAPLFDEYEYIGIDKYNDPYNRTHISKVIEDTFKKGKLRLF